jgi:magnesium transporter
MLFMLKAVLKPEVEDLIRDRAWSALRDVLQDWPSPEVADLLMEMAKSERALLFRALARRQAADVFAHLSLDQQESLLRDLSNEETRHLLHVLPPDDRTALLEELPGPMTRRLMDLLSPADLRETHELLGYPEESIGRLMTPDYVAVKADWSISQALEHIRRSGRLSETINRILVVDEDWRLLDDLELRRFILAEPGQKVEEIMDHQYVYVAAADDREEAVRAMQRYDQYAMAVVDSDGVLVGLVTADDVMDVAEEEATEDFHKIATVQPLRTSLREATVNLLYRKRVGWLLALVFMNVFSGQAIAAYEETIEAVVALVFFLPLLIDSGGNAGSQSATLMVRALATGDVRLPDWFKLLSKEILIALALGLTMAVGVALIASFRAPEVIFVVSLTMVLIVMTGSLIGMSAPFLLTRFGLDPATASAPLITSMADISGVLIYFSLASWYLGA